MGKQFPKLPPAEESIKKREERIAGKGDVFFEHSRMLFIKKDRITPSPPMAILLKYELTIEELTNEKIILLYKKSSNPEPPFIANLFKPKQLEYSLADKVIRIEDYESKKKYTFKILAIEEGKIKYKRT